MESDAIIAVTLQAADLGDTTTVHLTLAAAGLAVAELVEREAELHPEEEPKVNIDGNEELAADKGHHSGAVLEHVKALEVTTYIPDKKQAGKHNWDGKAERAAGGRGKPGQSNWQLWQTVTSWTVPSSPLFRFDLA
jgi:hypothetical protein